MIDKVLQFIQISGPLLPVDIRRALKIDSIFIGAYLSELTKSGKIKFSNAKIGNSPLYYVSGQEEKLNILEQYLPTQQKKAMNILHEKLILRDSDLDEVIKASMRAIKDFAVPLKVNKEILFWKWHVLSHQDAVEIIKRIMTDTSREKIAAPLLQGSSESSSFEKIEEKSFSNQQIVIQKISPELTFNTEFERLKTKLKKKSVIERSREKVSRKIQAIRDAREIEREISRPNDENKINDSNEEKEEQKIDIPANEVKDELMQKFASYCNEKDIQIKEYTIVRPNREIEIVASIPSAVGRVDYFCGIRNKKRCNEGDLSSVVIKAQSRNLPTLFVSTGDVTKKAFSMIGKELKQVVIQKI